MKMPAVMLLAVAATAPLTVDFTPGRRDSSETTFTIGAGGGTYADIARGCNGEILSSESRHFRDKGFAVEHRFAGPAVLGVRASSLGDGGARYPGGPPEWFWNPYGALESDGGGFGVGYIVGYGDWDDFAVPAFSGHIRLGDPRKSQAIAVRMFEDVPSFSSAGMVSLGVGFSPRPRTEMWLGVGGGPPYDGVGMFLQAKTPLWRDLTVNTGIRLGVSEGVTESGFAMGCTWSAVGPR